MIPSERRSHWQNVYLQKSEQEVSWTQADPEPSLGLIEKFADDQQAATADGFTAAQAGLVLEGDIGGKRYSTEGFADKAKDKDNAAQAFNHPYNVYVRESPSVVGMGLRILATPVTVAADGVLVLGGIVLLPIAVIAIEANGGLRIM